MTPRQKHCNRVTHIIDAAVDNPAVVVKPDVRAAFIECTLSEDVRPGKAPQPNSTSKVQADIRAIMRATSKVDIDADKVHRQSYAKRSGVNTPEAIAARAR